MKYLIEAAAADYLDFDVTDLCAARKHGRGPGYIKPTPKKIFYLAENLDAWRR